MANRTAIITLLYNNYNYGCYLQAYALQKTLDDLDIDNQIIRLDRFYIRKRTRVIRFLKILFSCFASKDIRNMNRAIMSKRKAFRKFEKLMRTSSKIYNKDNINDICALFDCFISGSDQVWSPVSGTDETFLAFVNSSKKKLSYAASIGADTISDDYREYMKSKLEKFDSLSVREIGAKTIVESIVREKKCRIDLDPTLLINKDYWRGLAKNGEVREKYILLYFLGEHDEAWNEAVEYAKRFDLKVINIPYNKMIFSSRDYSSSYSVNGIGPADFLGLVNNASYVLTDSYHGVIFSIIFEKQYKIFNRMAENVNGSMSGRIDSLLTILDLSYDTIENPCDYELVNKNVEEKRRDSINYLKRSILSEEQKQ